nr:hypothetical protein [uncultured Dysosmobacter sp.]
MINISLQNMDCLKIEDEWNFSNDTEYLMHTIHTYPAKFPAFIAKKAFDYAEAEGVTIFLYPFLSSPQSRLKLSWIG